MMTVKKFEFAKEIKMFRYSLTPTIALATLLFAATTTNAQTSRAANVFTNTVNSQEFSETIEAIGTLQPLEEVDLTVNDAGQVKRLYFEDGERVKKGKLLVSLDQSELQALVEAEVATVDEAQRQLDRVNRLIVKRAVSQSEVDEAQRDLDNAKAQLRAVQARQKDRDVRAPFNGVLGFRQISLGAFVQPGDMVAHLVDDSAMYINFPVPSIHLRHLKRGIEVSAITDDFPGKMFMGEIQSVDNAIDPVTRTVSVRAKIPNPDQLLLSGMFMEVSVKADPRNVTAVPEQAIQSLGPKNFVYVVDRTKTPITAHKLTVTLGSHQGEYFEVLSGLKTGQEIVTDGIIQVRDGGTIKIQKPSILQSQTVESSDGSGGGASNSALR